MKKILLLLIITSIAFTQTKWRQSYLDTLGGLVYSPTSEKPYTGKVFELYKNGAKQIEGSYKAGRPNGKWSFYAIGGELIRQIDYKKNITLEYSDLYDIHQKDNLMNYLLGEWEEEYQIFEGDTISGYEFIVEFFQNVIIERIKTSNFEFLDSDKWYQWVKRDIEYLDDNMVKIDNAKFLNKDFIEYAKEQGFYNQILTGSFVSEVNIIDFNSFIEEGENEEGEKYLLKYVRLKEF